MYVLAFFARLFQERFFFVIFGSILQIATITLMCVRNVVDFYSHAISVIKKTTILNETIIIIIIEGVTNHEMWSRRLSGRLLVTKYSRTHSDYKSVYKKHGFIFILKM